MKEELHQSSDFSLYFLNVLEKKVAVKIMKKKQILDSNLGFKGILREIKVHWKLGECSNILELFELYESEENIYMVLEYQTKGSLLNQIIEVK